MRWEHNPVSMFSRETPRKVKEKRRGPTSLAFEKLLRGDMFSKESQKKPT